MSSIQSPGGWTGGYWLLEKKTAYLPPSFTRSMPCIHSRWSSAAGRGGRGDGLLMGLAEAVVVGVVVIVAVADGVGVGEGVVLPQLLRRMERSNTFTTLSLFRSEETPVLPQAPKSKDK